LNTKQGFTLFVNNIEDKNNGKAIVFLNLTSYLCRLKKRVLPNEKLRDSIHFKSRFV